MKLKNRFSAANLIMLITSVAVIGVISVCFLIIFILKYPIEELYISRSELLNPIILSRAIGDFFQKNPESVIYLLLWIGLCLLVIIVTMTIVTHMLSVSIQKPIDTLTNAADNIRNGDLSFIVMGSEYDEMDLLCQSFDSMRQSLKNANEKERILKEERSLLLANLSHDLKTPVTSIKGYIEGIRDGVADTPEKQRRYLDTIYAKAVMIDDMVNNLSMFSKLELSKLAFNFVNDDINAFLRDILEEYRLDIERNSMSLVTDISTKTVIVKMDYEKLGRLFANIIENSIKYKKKENGIIKVSSQFEDGGIYISFTDDGAGIKESEIGNVFESFYRADDSRNMNISGSGLGLGIAKQIAEKHGGKIWIKSPGENMGATTIVYLPCVKGKSL